MTDRWRLVGKELYDIQADPGQQNNVAGDFPQIVAELNAAYEDWWTDISRRFDEYCPTIIGSEHQAKTMLTCQDWHGEVIPYNQQHVRAAIDSNGFWDVEFVEAGHYEFTLRRWPEELDLPIGAAVPEPEMDPLKYNASLNFYGLPSGVIRATKARMKIGSFDDTVPVEADARSVVFRLTFPKGQFRLQTWLTDAAGKSWGAYYVYVERLTGN
jgi:hypothetical protein